MVSCVFTDNSYQRSWELVYPIHRLHIERRGPHITQTPPRMYTGRSSLSYGSWLFHGIFLSKYNYLNTENRLLLHLI